MTSTDHPSLRRSHAPLPGRLAALCLAALSLCLVPAGARAAGKSKKPRLAILDFPVAAGGWGCGGWAGSEGRMSSVLRDLFTTGISESADGRLRLVERERLADLRGELSFQQSGEVDASTAQKLGKLLGAQFILTGKITRFACKISDASTGWGVGALVGKVTGSGLAGAVAGSAEMKRVNFSGRLDARLLSVRTGEILATFKDENETGDTSVRVAGGGTGVAYDDELASKVFEPIAQKMSGGVVRKAVAAAGELEDEEAEDPRPVRVAAAGGAAVAAAASAGGSAPAGGGQASGGQGGTAGGATESLGEVYSPRFDFVPGENVLFFDDFSDTEPGDFPARWKVGGYKGGQMEVVELNGKHWFKGIKPPQGNMQRSSADMRADCEKRKLPSKFTVEYDVPSSANLELWFVGYDAVPLHMGPTYVASANAKATGLAPSAKPIRHVSVAASGTNLKVYYDGERVLLDPDGLPTAAQEARRQPCLLAIGLLPDGDAKGTWGTHNGPPRDDMMFTNFRLAEGGKDYAKDLAMTGRLVTHGITFDSGSDVIRPESGPTLRKIQKLLQDDSSLAFEIQGHTDNQGGDKLNGPLSERRAAAVKAWLVKQGIEEGRLTSRGLGATKPLKPNDTPEGRAENRRVELVKRGA